MGLKKGNVRPAEKGSGKICVGILFQQGHKRAAGTALSHPQPAQPLTAMGLKDIHPPVESAGTYAKRAIDAGQAPALAKIGIKHAEDEKEAVAHVRNDRIKQNCMCVPAGRAFDPRHPDMAWANLV